MRFYDIAVFVLIFQIITGFFAASAETLGFKDFIKFEEPVEEELLRGEETFKEQVIESEEVTSQDLISRLVGLVSDAVKTAVGTLFKPLTRFVLSIPYMMMHLGASRDLAFALSAPIYVIELFGLFQLITGRGFKQMD